MNLLSYISFFSVLIPLVMSLVQWNNIPNKWSLILWLLIFSLSADILSYLTGWLFRNSFPVVNLFSLIEFLFLAYLFGNYYKIEKVVRVVCGIYLLYFVVDVLLFESPFRLLTTANVLGMLLIIVLLLYFIYSQLTDQTITQIHHEPVFWLAFAFLLYYSESIFATLTYNHIITLPPGNNLSWSVWDIHNVSNILKNSIITVALWLNYRTVKDPKVV